MDQPTHIPLLAEFVHETTQCDEEIYSSSHWMVSWGNRIKKRYMGRQEASTVQGTQYNRQYRKFYRLQMQEHLLKRVKLVYNNNANTQIASVIVKLEFFACFCRLAIRSSVRFRTFNFSNSIICKLKLRCCGFGFGIYLG